MTGTEVGAEIGPYIVDKLLPSGKGGMARVCVATRTDELGRAQRVALKVVEIVDARKESAAALQDFYIEALNNEVETLRQLRHPGIVHTYPIPWGDDRRLVYSARAQYLPGQPWYFVMEYLQGGSVADRIKQETRLSVREAVETAHQVSQALDYIHSKKVAHLDIKTENILYRFPPADDVRPEAVLIDFGIARRHGQTGLDAGSLSFLAPERLQELRGEPAPEQAREQVRTPADVYGLGIILYHMLTGRLPFTGRSKNDITTAILTTTPTRPTQFNPELARYPKIEDLILWLLEKNPVARPTAEQVAGYLDLAMAPPRYSQRNISQASGDVSPGKDPSKPTSNHRLAKGVVTLLGAAVIGTCGFAAGRYLVTPSGPETPSRVPTAIVAEPAVTALPVAPTAPADKESRLTASPIPVVASPVLTPQPTARTTQPTAVPAMATRVPTRTPAPTATPAPPRPTATRAPSSPTVTP